HPSLSRNVVLFTTPGSRLPCTAMKTPALVLFLAACSSIEGPHQADRPDAAQALDAAVPDARMVSRPDAVVPDAARSLDAGMIGPVIAGIETIAPATATSGQKVDIRCELRDSNGDVAPWPASLVATIQIGDTAIISAQHVAVMAGTTTVACSAGGFTDASPATVSAVPAAPATVTTRAARATVGADPADPGTDVDCVLRDAAGNVVADGSKVSVALANPAAGTVAGAHVHFTLAGTQTVSCVRAGTTTTPAQVEVRPGRP